MHSAMSIAVYFISTHIFMPVSALTHIMQIRHNFDIVNLPRYRAGFAQCYFNGAIHTWRIFHREFAVIFLQCDFSRPLFIVRFLFCREIFHVQTGWALLFVLQLIALLFVFPIDNIYEYILMHFKGSTDLVNSAT